MTNDELECPVCGGCGLAHADYCERGWAPERPAHSRAIPIGIALGLFALVLAYLLTACTVTDTPPQEPQPVCHVYGFNPATGLDSSWVVSCTQYGYHHHMKDTVGGSK